MKYPLKGDMRITKTFSIGFVALLLLSLAMAIPLPSSAEHPAQIIWVEPALTFRQECVNFTVDIMINITDPDGAGLATGMFGFMYKLQWDNTVLEAVEIQTHTDNIPSGDLLPGWTMAFVAANDTAPGYHSYAVSAIQGVAFTGVASLCTYTFHVVGNGSCALDIYDDILVHDDSTNPDMTIAHTTGDGYFSDPYPRAIFTHDPQYPSANQTVTFNASASFDPDGTIVSYAWDFGDGITDTGMIVTHNYTVHSVYMVTLTVTDDSSLADSTSRIVNVGTVALFTYYPEFPLIGEAVTFNATESRAAFPPIVNYVWDFDDGNITTIGDDEPITPIIKHAYGAAGIFNVTLTVTDNSSLADSMWGIVKVGRWPVAEFYCATSPINRLVNRELYFDARDSDDPNGEIVSYEWEFGDGTKEIYVQGVNLSSTTTHNYTTFGAYNVTLTVTDNETLTDSSSVLITVLAKPIAAFSWSPEQPKAGEMVTFNASASYDPDGAISAYEWVFGDGHTTEVIESTVAYTYTVAGIFNVTLTVTDDTILTAGAMHSITIVEASSSISISASPTTFEVGENTTISGSITPIRVGATVTIHYRPTGGTWSTLSTETTDSNGQYSYVWTPGEDGTYEVKASWPGDANTVGAESSSETITVEKAPPPQDYLVYVGIVIVVVIAAAIIIYFLRVRKS